MGDPSKYKAVAAYAPVDPADHGGALYGEKMWMTGAASDALSSALGPNDPCCGSHVEGGCGKCVLISATVVTYRIWISRFLAMTICNTARRTHVDRPTQLVRNRNRPSAALGTIMAKARLRDAIALVCLQVK